MGKRGGRDGGRVKRHKKLRERDAKFRLNEDLNRIPGTGGHLILQLAQLINEAGREDVRAGAEDLTELDECRSQLFERQSQVAGGRDISGRWFTA